MVSWCNLTECVETVWVSFHISTILYRNLGDIYSAFISFSMYALDFLLRTVHIVAVVIQRFVKCTVLVRCYVIVLNTVQGS